MLQLRPGDEVAHKVNGKVGRVASVHEKVAIVRYRTPQGYSSPRAVSRENLIRAVKGKRREKARKVREVIERPVEAYAQQAQALAAAFCEEHPSVSVEDVLRLIDQAPFRTGRDEFAVLREASAKYHRARELATRYLRELEEAKRTLREIYAVHPELEPEDPEEAQGDD